MDAHSKFLWLTDTHVRFWARYRFLNAVLDENPATVLHTGDITEGPFLEGLLDFVGKRIGRPFIFCLGNHDIWGSSLEATHNKVRALCKKHRNLIWITEAGIIPLNEESCVIGDDGWYSATEGNPDYIRYTFDWFLVEEFRQLPSMTERLAMFRNLAEKSATTLALRLEEAVATYKTVYLLTHEPPWAEAHRSTNPWFEKFWEPYNTNPLLGQALEKVMEKHKNRRLIVLTGHTHLATTIYPSRNIECRVGSASYTRIHDSDIRRLYI
jgi:predicted MPP superfamily phosphohydrolase